MSARASSWKTMPNAHLLMVHFGTDAHQHACPPRTHGDYAARMIGVLFFQNENIFDHRICNQPFIL